jgi:hypothetical protein
MQYWKTKKQKNTKYRAQAALVVPSSDENEES